MRLFNPLTIIIFSFLLLASSRAALAQQDQTQTGDPVADAARKAREQKKNAPKPKKVLTDEDIAGKAPETATAPTQPAPDGTASAGEKAEVDLAHKATEKEDPNSEKAWRKRFAEQRTKISDAEQERDVLQRELEKASVQYYSDPQKALNEQLTRNEINEKTDKLATQKQKVEDLKKQLSDMEDALRAAGGDSGWAR
jgi:glucose/arabinose dehydrogenase